MKVREVLQRISSALMVPIVILPLAAILFAIGSQTGLEPVLAAGQAIMLDYLPLIFAVGVAIGFCQQDGMAALAAVVGWSVMTKVMVAVGAQSDAGVLGGIVIGTLVVILWRFRTIRFPEWLGLFSGKRFIPVAMTVAGLVAGLGFGAVWPSFQGAMQSLGEWILAAGPNGMFAYGVLNRLLIPTGLHHILQNLLQFVIGAATIGGKVYTGEVPRFFAGDPNAGYIMAGWYIVMMFSIPAACLAITHEAKPSERRRVGGLMGTAALTSLMLGITEPAEFAFMFAAPVLFGVHAVLTGLALWVSRLLAVRHWGFALPLYIANLKLSQNALVLLPVGVAFALVYYFLFRFLIRRFDLPTPGRRDFAVDSAAIATVTGRARGYLAALGGAENVSALEACMTRLRVRLKNPAAADTAAMTALGASGVTRPGHDLLQVVVGTDAELIRAEIAGMLRIVVIQAPLSGRVVPLSELPDAVFAGGMVGPGIAIDPSDGRLVAPVDGEILQVHGAKHAVVMTGPAGLELLLHMGLDTVELDGVGFTVHCRAGERVVAGQLLAEFDPEAVRAAGKSTLSPVIILNQDTVSALAPTAAPVVRAGSDALLTVTMK